MRGRASTLSICRFVAWLTLALCVTSGAWAQQFAGAGPSGQPIYNAGSPPATAGDYYRNQTSPAVPTLPQQTPRRAQPQPVQPVQIAAPQALQGYSQPQPLPAPAQGITRLPAVGQKLPAAGSNPNHLQPIAPASYQSDPGNDSGDGTYAAPPSPSGAPRQLQLEARPMQAQSADAWTLERVEATTINFNPILRRSLARIDSARGDAQQAGLYPNPSFDTNNPEVFAGPATQINWGFQQTIVVKGKLRLDRAAANEVVRQKEHGLTQDRFGLLLAVRQQFYTVLAAQRRNEMLRQIREIAAASVRAAQARLDAGEGTLSEVLLLQTELARTEIALQTAQTILLAERRQLAAIIGRPDLSIPQVAGQLTFGFPNFDENYLREFVVSQNAQVQIARREIERNQILLRRARVEPYPNLHGGPAYASNLTSSAGSQQFWFNIQFDIPLWNRNQGNIRSTQGDLADAVASLGVLQNELLRQVEEVLGRYRAARQSEERIRTQVLPVATRAQQLVKDGYQKGILDISTFLQAQRALSDATLSYIDALENVWTTAAEIASLLQLDRFP